MSSPTFGQTDPVVIKVINDVQNADSLVRTQKTYEKLKDDVEKLSTAIAGQAAPLQSDIQLLETLAQAANHSAIEIDRLKEALKTAGTQTKDLNEAIRSGSYAFQDFAQGGFGAIINNTDRLGTAVGRLLGVGRELGPWMQGIATAAFIVSENWGTIAKWFGQAPSEEFIGRVHRSNEAMKELGGRAKLTADAYLELIQAQAKQREEREAESAGYIPEKGTEAQEAVGKSVRDFIAQELRGSRSRIFGGETQDTLREFMRANAEEIRRSPEELLARQAEEKAARAREAYAEAEARGDFTGQAGFQTQLALRRQVEGAEAEARKFRAELEDVITKSINRMFQEATRLGDQSQGYRRLEEFLESGGFGRELQGLREAVGAGTREAQEKGVREKEQAENERTRREESEERKETTATNRELADALKDYNNAVGEAGKDLKAAIDTRPKEAESLAAEARRREQEAFESLIGRIDRQGGPARAREQLEGAGLTSRNFARMLEEAIETAGERVARGDTKQGRQQKIADEQAKRAEAELQRTLGKSPAEAEILSAIAQFNSTMFGNRNQREMAEARLTAGIQNAVRASLIGHPEITPERRNELIGQAPRVFGQQFDTMMDQARRTAAGMGMQGMMAERQAIEAVMRQIMIGFASQTRINNGLNQKVSEFSNQMGVINNLLRNQVGRQKRGHQ